MSIIQDIRDKYARISVIAIALALIGFILTDYFSGRNRGMGSGRSNSVGSVNGRSISNEEFAKSVQQSEEAMTRQGYPEAYAKQQAVEQAWGQQINRVILGAEFDKLGMRIGKRERGDILYGANAPEDIKKAGTDEKTGQYDPALARQKVDQMMKSNQTPQAQKDQFKDYINQLDLQRKSEKYGALFTNSINFPKWFIELQTADNSLIGNISVVRVTYADSAIVDSTIKISDKEIESYISKHKDEYKQEESRTVNYVSFSAAPTAGDSMAVKNQVALLKPEFDTTKDVSTFLASKGSLDPAIYSAPDLLSASVKDSIIKLAKDQVFGPYLDGGNYVLAKLLDSRSLPDSVKCRHILLGTQDRSGNAIMDDSTAHKRADSIALAIKNGANFDSLETKFTTDEAAHRDKGVMTFSSATIQGEGFAKEFGDFILIDGKPGDNKVVKTQFGWHYIEIMSFIKPITQYKVAYLKQEVIASQQTDDNALQEATNFSGNSRDPKTFDTAFEKTYKAKGYNKTIAANIKRNDGQVQGMSSRNFVRNIYAAKLGEVLKPEPINIGNYKVYTVAVVTETLKEGTLTVDKARASIEPLLRNKKKAAMLKQKAGNITTLEAASAALGKPIENVDSLRMKTGGPRANFSNEPRVFGATFNPANKGKVVPEVLEGISGVYVVRVNSVSATSSATGSTDQQRKEKYDNAKQVGSNYLIEALKKAATIKDKRSDIY